MKNKALPILFLALTTGLAAQVPTNVPINGLVGWWPLDGNLNDYSGNNLNGTSNGLFSSGHNLQPMSAISLNGNNQMINLPGSNHYNTNQFTIHFWTKANSYNIHNKVMYGEIGGAGRFGLNWNENGLSYSPFTCSAQYLNGNGTNSGGINTNIWYNIVFAIDSSITKFYINGNLVSTQNSASNLVCFQSNMNLYFGGDILGGLIEYYSGYFDDIGVWNRVLNDDEILTLFTGCQQSIITQPQNSTASMSSNATFNTVSSSQNAIFQWQTDTGLGFQNLNNAGQYSGVNTNTLTISNINLSNNNQPFRCIISSGSCADTSQTAILNVCGTITSQPLAQSTTPNQNVQFSTSSTDPSATYQWQSDVGFGFQNLNNVGQYSGVTTNSLTVSNVSLSNNNQPFRCIITSGSCSDTSQVAILTVNNNMDTENWSNAGLVVYPNPAQDHMVIKVNPSWIGSSYAIMDAAGRTLLHGQLNALEENISLKTFSPGIYLIKVGDKFQQYLRVIKE